MDDSNRLEVARERLIPGAPRGAMYFDSNIAFTRPILESKYIAPRGAPSSVDRPL
jgi:hypothetical protein